MSISVSILDDHEIVQRGFENALKSEGIRVLDTYCNSESFLKDYQKSSPDVCLIDIRLPGRDGLYALEKLRQNSQEQKVVIISGSRNPTYVARSIALGANDFILKSNSVREIVETIKCAAAGSEQPKFSAFHRIRKTMQTKGSGDFETSLTNRELQVVRHLAYGLSNREIGYSLHISIETVKEHVQNILRKIDVNDRTQAAVWAVKSGLVLDEI